MRFVRVVCALVFFGLVMAGAMSCGKKAPPRPPDEAGYGAP